jgi:hypothetical protein
MKHWVAIMSHTFAHWMTEPLGSLCFFLSVLDFLLHVVVEGNNLEVVARDFHGGVIVAGDVEAELDSAVGAL